MPLPSSAALRELRSVKASSYAAFAFAFFCAWVLPLPVYRDTAGWHWSAITLIQVPTAIAVGIGVRRGLWPIVVLAALVGLYGFLLFGLAVASVLDGTAAQPPMGPSWVVSKAIALPFALCWSLGGVAFLRAWRAPTQHAER